MSNVEGRNLRANVEYRTPNVECRREELKGECRTPNVEGRDLRANVEYRILNAECRREESLRSVNYKLTECICDVWERRPAAINELKVNVEGWYRFAPSIIKCLFLNRTNLTNEINTTNRTGLSVCQKQVHEPLVFRI